jgi:hypothetical protein
MNRLLVVKGTQTNRTTGTHKTATALLAVIVLSLFTSNSLANRPSMDDSSNRNIDNTVEQTAVPTASSAPTASSRPQSAVENMMQYDQTRQSGDVLVLPAKEIHPGETISIKLLDFPRRGMSMNKVKLEYGQPIEASDSIGSPPITRWIYADRVVYFEFSTVIHTVAR